MTTSDSQPVVLHANPEHAGLRFAVIAILGVLVWLCFVLIRALVTRFAPQSLLDYTFALSCTLAVLLALAISWGVEALLKRYWHSGEQIILDVDGIRRVRKAGPVTDSTANSDVSMRWNLPMSRAFWYFRLKGYARAGREKRVQSSWLCLAAELQQDDTRLSVYTYMPPRKAAALLESFEQTEPFYELPMAVLYEEAGKKRRGAQTRPEIPAKWIHGKEGRYWIAERRRWQGGAELQPEDFVSLLNYVERRATHQEAAT